MKNFLLKGIYNVTLGTGIPERKMSGDRYWSGRFLARGVFPYMSYISTCGPKGYGFSGLLFINRVANSRISWS